MAPFESRRAMKIEVEQIYGAALELLLKNCVVRCAAGKS